MRGASFGISLRLGLHFDLSSPQFYPPRPLPIRKLAFARNVDTVDTASCCFPASRPKTSYAGYIRFYPVAYLPDSGEAVQKAESIEGKDIGARLNSQLFDEFRGQWRKSKPVYR